MHQNLGVEHYAKAVPRIPIKELRASSVQNSKFPAYRWHLHTRKVPTRPQETSSASHPASIPKSTAARARGRDDGRDGAADSFSEPNPDSSATHVAQASASRKAKFKYAENVVTPFVCATA